MDKKNVEIYIYKISSAIKKNSCHLWQIYINLEDLMLNETSQT